MLDYAKQIITGQFEAALSMLRDCVEVCPAEHWEEKIATISFRQVAYHALFFVDFHLSPNEESFQLRDFHHEGGDERSPPPSAGMNQEQSLAYAAICRQKAIETLASETVESLKGPSGFDRRKMSRGELHIYNIRHVQHHTGQLSACLRRLGEAYQDRSVLPWVPTGWR